MSSVSGLLNKGLEQEKEMPVPVVGAAWTAREGSRLGGANPLDVESHATQEAHRLLRAVTSQIQHARYFTIHALVAAEAATLDLNELEVIDLLRRCEVVVGAIATRHLSPHPGLRRAHGVQAIAAGMRDEGMLNVARLAAPNGYTKERWGFLDRGYRRAETRMGLIDDTEGKFVPGAWLDQAATRDGLRGLLDLARRDTVDFGTLDAHGNLCLCGVSDSADGASFLRVLMGEGKDARSRAAVRAQSVRLVLRLIILHGGVDAGQIQAQLQPFLLFDPAPQRDSVLASLEVTEAWKGVALRAITANAWGALWAWVVHRIPTVAMTTSVDSLAKLLADEFPAVTVRQFVAALPPGIRDDGLLLPAERDVDDGLPTGWVRQLFLGAFRRGQLTPQADSYFDEQYEDGAYRLSPTWLRARLEHAMDRPLPVFVASLVEQMVLQSQAVALQRAEIDPRTGTDRLPTGVFVRDGLVFKEADYWGGGVNFRWDTLAKLLCGLGLIDYQGGRWKVTEKGASL